MKNSKLFSGTILMAAFALTVGCEDTSLEDLLSEGDAQVSESYMKTEASLYNLYSVVDVSLRDSLFQVNDSAMVDGATVIRSGSNVTINFGTGVIGSDGRTRKGIIEVIESGDYMTLASLDIELKGYSVNDEKVTGSIELDKAGSDFGLVITGFSADQEIEIDADKTISWRKGFTTLSNSDDDVFDISGTATGKDLKDNRELSTSITEAMNYDRSCEFKMVSGIIELTLQPNDSIPDVTEAAIDFLADDACNNLAKIKLKQGETEIEVTKQFNGF
ncbi:hypothetical protein [Owenweeksia hongkongensis]|uniref:hypothetical protein n=1 Tax=Owenweeksia hongkongensis TaxID=253245 RepID=UPI003A9198F3